MLQALIKRGHVFVEDVPNPNVSSGAILIKVMYSCISAGTEIMAMQSSVKVPLIRQAMRQPEKVEKAWKMFKSEGVAETIAKIRKSEVIIPAIFT